MLLGAVRAYQMPASQALLPQLVGLDALPRALALSATALQGAVIAGPALGGFAYAWRPAWAISVRALPISTWQQAMSYLRPSSEVVLVRPRIACLVAV